MQCICYLALAIWLWVLVFRTLLSTDFARKSWIHTYGRYISVDFPTASSLAQSLIPSLSNSTYKAFASSILSSYYDAHRAIMSSNHRRSHDSRSCPGADVYVALLWMPGILTTNAIPIFPSTLFLYRITKALNSHTIQSRKIRLLSYLVYYLFLSPPSLYLSLISFSPYLHVFA